MPVIVRKPKAIILDIEGTVCEPSFIRDKLSPLLRSKLEDYLEDSFRQPEVAEWISRLRKVCDIPMNDKGETIAAIVESLQRKSPKVLSRELNILMWIWLYRKRKIESIVYEEVSTVLHDWKFEKDIPNICLFSSSSIIPQKLMICRTGSGNLLPLIDYFIGPKFGSKDDSDSYRNIADGLGLSTAELLFITDCVEEVNAASRAGCCSVLIFRDGNDIPNKGEPLHKVIKIRSFDDLRFKQQ